MVAKPDASVAGEGQGSQEVPAGFKAATFIVEDSGHTYSGGVPPRVEELNNTRYRSKQIGGIVVPDSRVIEAILAESPKVEYFGAFNGEEDAEARLATASSPFYELLFYPLIEKVKSDFPDKPLLAFRGVKASINGTQHYSYGHSDHIPDVSELVSRGGDRAQVFNVAVGDMTGSNPTAITTQLHRVSQYAGGTDMMRLDISEDAPEVADTIFPVILIYDVDGLQKTGGAYWEVKVRPEYKPQDVLLKAYLLDAPVLR